METDHPVPHLMCCPCHGKIPQMPNPSLPHEKLTDLWASMWLLTQTLDGQETQLCFLAHRGPRGGNPAANSFSELKQGVQQGMNFLNLSKMYNRVLIPGLIYKLSSTGFSNTSLEWLNSFLTNHQQCVLVNGCKSTQQLSKSSPSTRDSLGTVVEILFIWNKELSTHPTQIKGSTDQTEKLVAVILQGIQLEVRWRTQSKNEENYRLKCASSATR